MREGGDELLTIAEAARLVGITARTLRHHVQQRHLAAERIGRDWVLRRRDVEAFAREPRPTGIHRTAAARPEEPGGR